MYPMNKLSAKTSSQNWGRPKDGGFAELEVVLMKMKMFRDKGKRIETCNHMKR